MKKKIRVFFPHSRLDSLAVAGHVHGRVIRIVQRLHSKQVILQVAPQLRKIKQLSFIKYSPTERVRILVTCLKRAV